MKLRKGFNFPHDDLVTIFPGFVRPLAEYAALVWHSYLTVQETVAYNPKENMGNQISHNDQALDVCVKKSFV